MSNDYAEIRRLLEREAITAIDTGGREQVNPSLVLELLEMTRGASFEDWIDEIENYGARRERFFEEVAHNPGCQWVWLKTSYENGYNWGRKDGWAAGFAAGEEKGKRK